MNLLDTRDSPADLRRLPRAQLVPLALLPFALRGFLLDSVARTGGHLWSKLGSVERTIAPHDVFDMPRDRIVWDVGHQCHGIARPLLMPGLPDRFIEQGDTAALLAAGAT